MPSRGTPLQCLRVRDDLWRLLAEKARAQGTDRSAVLRQFIRWYVGMPGAELPERPESRS